MLLKELIAEVYNAELCFDVRVRRGHNFVVFSTNRFNHHDFLGYADTINEALKIMIKAGTNPPIHTQCFQVYPDKVLPEPCMSHYWRS